MSAARRASRAPEPADLFAHAADGALRGPGAREKVRPGDPRRDAAETCADAAETPSGASRSAEPVPEANARRDDGDGLEDGGAAGAFLAAAQAAARGRATAAAPVGSGDGTEDPAPAAAPAAASGGATATAASSDVAGDAALLGLTDSASRAARTKTPQPHHVEHRRRLRDRFMRAGAAALADYELLELVLFRAIPRRDVKPLAKRLLERFGDFNAVAAAPPRLLTEVSGVGDAVVQELKIVEAAAHRFAQVGVLQRDAITSWDELVAYCRQRLAQEATEQFRILFLDRKNLLIADEAQARGTVDHVPVYPREVVKRALELGASALVLVHNHPSGDPTPSRADIDMTRRVAEACRAVGVTLHDHVIVGRQAVASFHDLGLLDG